MTDTPGKWPSEAKPVPRWVTSWPDWYGVKGNVAVVPASDYDNLGRYVRSGPASILPDEPTEEAIGLLKVYWPSGTREQLTEVYTNLLACGKPL